MAASSFDDKINRKVRFTLPGPQHSTQKYINGMLVTVNTNPAYAPLPLAPSQTFQSHSMIVNSQNKSVNSNNRTESHLNKVDINLNLVVNNKNYEPSTSSLPIGKIIKSQSSSHVKKENSLKMNSQQNKLTNVKSLPAINEQTVQKLSRRDSGLFSANNKSREINLNENKLKLKTKASLKSLNQRNLNFSEDECGENFHGKKINFLHFNFSKNKNEHLNSSKKQIEKISKVNFNHGNNNNHKNKDVELNFSNFDLNKFENINYLRNQYYSRKSIGQFLFVPDVNDDDQFEINILNQNQANTTQNNHSSHVWNLLERWRRLRLISSTNKNENNLQNRNSAYNSSVNNHICMESEEKRSVLVPPYRSYKMSLDKIPLVTTLLRAARDANELLLKECLGEIKLHGIPREDLNSTDLNGRTAISYVCSTSLINILDEMLRLPGIDVNKADNEGNTPLHFAAQAGIFDSVNMLLTRSRSIQVDAKNNLGFTPLMKAALQGRTRCAKLLIFAGANPCEIDSGRGLRAEEWARFCGRYSCAEMISKCSRTKGLEKSSSFRLPNDSEGIHKVPVARSKTNPAQIANSHVVSSSESFRSRFSKVLPFSFLREKHSNQPKTLDSTTDLVTYLSATALCASGPALPTTNGNVNLIKSIIRPLEVPKLEVTPAHQTLIRTMNMIETSKEKCTVSVNNNNNVNCDNNQQTNMKKKKILF